MHLSDKLRAKITSTLSALAILSGVSASAEVTQADVPVFITIGQSNADGSAMYDATIDAAMKQWYTSDANTGKMKIWYRSTQVQNQSANALGEAARWAIDGTTTDAQPGWMQLWYRNENAQNRTAMNMIHGYGTYSTGTGTDCAQGRRGMEGNFGKEFLTAMPESELYVLKLGVSGSFISSWANPLDDTNWKYFYEKIYKPAITDLLAQGKRPRLAGVWWMQGCADRNCTSSFYKEHLLRLISRIHNDLGFADGKIYIGHIIKPGESEQAPGGSVQFGQGVRDAQDEVAAAFNSVEIVDTRNFPLQYESSFSGYLHFSHEGVNAIGKELASRVVKDGTDNWAPFSTPGKWSQSGTTAKFVPDFGNPEIEYTTDGKTVTATIKYAGFNDVKTYTLRSEDEYLGPGYLDCDGTRYMRIDRSDDFTIPAGGSMTISFNCYVPSWAASNSYYGLVCNNFRNTAGVRSGFDIFMGSSYQQTLANNAVPDSGSSTQATNFGGAWITTGYTPGNWAHMAWTYNGVTGESKIYINGVARRETTCQQTYYPITDFCDILVGARWELNNNPTTNIFNKLKGKISDLRFYSEALTTNEIKADADGIVEGKTLIAAYDFRDINGLTVTDISGNGHDGTLVGFPAYTSGSELTIEQPTGGKVTVYDNGAEVLSGQNVADGTTLTVIATPKQDYTLVEITVNGEPIEGNTFVMNGKATVSAKFNRDASAPTSVNVFTMNENGSKYYRIPAICCTNKGTLIAVGDKRGSDITDLPNTISVVMKRSTDNGETWSEMKTIAQGNSSTKKTYGDPGIVVDRETGTIICVFVGDTGFFTSINGSQRQGLYYVKSTDDGLTWTDPVSFTDQVWQSSWKAAFCASGAGFQDKQGRIMFVANARTNASSNTSGVYEYLVYTDDLGETWHVANPNGQSPEGGYGNESKVVELENGDLLMSMRYGSQRRFMTSSDRGATWGAPYKVPELIEPAGGSGCNGDIIRYPSADGQSRLLQTSAASTAERRDVSVFLSYDEGKTWPIKKKIVDGLSAYSSLTVLSDGSIGCFVEDATEVSESTGYNLVFKRFSLSWLTDGADNGGTATGHIVTIETPSSREGTLKVFNGDHEVFSGRKIEEGTVLSVAAEAKSPYILKSILINGEALDEGVTTFTVDGPTTVSALFERNADEPVVYTSPSGDGLSQANCYVETASTSGAVHDITIARTGKKGTNYEYADDDVIIVNPGQTFDLRLQGKKTSNTSYSVPSPQDLRYCVLFVFSDWDADGIFEHEIPTNSRFASKKYYGYHVNDTGFPGNTPCNFNYTLDVTHTFNVPDDAALTDTRIRVIYTEAWDGNVTTGNVDGDYQHINKGYSYDYAVRCQSAVGVDDIITDIDNAQVEYFNLQGMRVSGKLLPGVYIRRQGAKVDKVLVR